MTGNETSDPATVTVTAKAPDPPVASISGTTTAITGDAVELTGAYTDARLATDTFTETWAVTGPGSFSASGSGGAIDFTPSAAGTYHALYTVTDVTDSLSDSASQDVVVSAPPLPEVTIVATSPTASEVGPTTGTFTVTRTGAGAMMGALTVYLKTPTGSATNGTDYDTIKTSVSIPSGAASVDVTVTPHEDDLLEGIETVVLSLDSGNDYDLGTATTATVNIRDRAEVKSIVATKGVNQIPANGQRNVTTVQLELTQGDKVTYEAIPTDGGDWAPGQPVWTITGEADRTGPTQAVTFGTFVSTGVDISASTPSNPFALTTGATIIPYPTGMPEDTTTINADRAAYWASTAGRKLPAWYGTVFEHELTASAGATNADLAANDNSGKLKVWEFVEEQQPDGTFVLNRSLPFAVSPTGTLVDRIFSPTDSVSLQAGADGIPPTVTDSFKQDFLWGSTAADSVNRITGNYDPNNDTGWTKFVTDLPIDVSVAPSGYGWTVTTTDDSVAFPQPYSVPQSLNSAGNALVLVPYAYLSLSSGNTIAWSATAPATLAITLVGTVELTALDVASETASVNVGVYATVYDPNTGAPSEILLQSLNFAVSAKNGVAGMLTVFRINGELLNINHTVAGAAGSSGQFLAGVHLELEDGTDSENESVTAN